MTKKNKKKGQKSAPEKTAAEQKEKEDEDLDMLEDIKRDEDLYISESDVSNISNFIRTTNKSFNSLGNTVVATFNNRCSLAILHALIALFDLDSTDREDVIRRLNIIYIVWRLPDLEQNLRLKPTKTMSDVYTHPFATFLFYAEQLEKHVVEATLARIIITNNVSCIEKLTAPDFIQKANSLDLHSVDREAFIKWSELNTDHWPEITEEIVSLSKAMRELGCERKEHEAGMAEAFYPLVHNAPTMLPPRMAPLHNEDPIIKDYQMKKRDENEKEAISVIYSLSAGDDMQKRLLEAFQNLGPTVDEYQTAINSEMTPEELEESSRVITLEGDMSESSESEEEISDSDEDSEAEAEAKFRAMTEMKKEIELNDKVVEGCCKRILDGSTLTSSKLEVAIHFVRKTPFIHPQMLGLINAAAQDETLISWCRTNPKFAAEFMCRHAQTDYHDCCDLFKKYLTISENFATVLPSFEFVVKISSEFKAIKRFTADHKECVLNFVRNALKNVEEAKQVAARSVRLVAMFIIKLLQADILTVNEIASFVKPFCLKFSENRDCTTLYQHITDIQSGKGTIEDLRSSSLTSSSSSTTTTGGTGGTPSMMTTTTTTTSVNTNATSTTTTTTVIKQCGPAVIKQTSKKVVLSAGQAVQMKFHTRAFQHPQFQAPPPINPKKREKKMSRLEQLKAQKRNATPPPPSYQCNHHHRVYTSGEDFASTVIELIDGEEEILTDSDEEEQPRLVLKTSASDEKDKKKDENDKDDGDQKPPEPSQPIPV